MDARGDFGLAELAGAECRRHIASALVFLAVGIAATVLADQRPTVLHVLAVTLAVGGYRLWERRTWIPEGLPAQHVPVEAIKPASRGWVFWLVFFPAMFGALFGALELVGGGSSTLLGFCAGAVVSDAVMAVRVAHWQRRHGQTLVWVGWKEPCVLSAPAVRLGAPVAPA